MTERRGRTATAIAGGRTGGVKSSAAIPGPWWREIAGAHMSGRRIFSNREPAASDAIGGGEGNGQHGLIMSALRRAARRRIVVFARKAGRNIGMAAMESLNS